MQNFMQATNYTFFNILPLGFPAFEDEDIFSNSKLLIHLQHCFRVNYLHKTLIKV